MGTQVEIQLPMGTGRNMNNYQWVPSGIKAIYDEYTTKAINGYTVECIIKAIDGDPDVE